jgi:hypothetical protein
MSEESAKPSEPKSVFILGAGASYEVGLPVGAGLKKEIANILDIWFDDYGSQLSRGDAVVMDAFRQIAAQLDSRRDPNPLIHAGRAIRDAMPQALSIDNFLDAHAGVQHMEIAGKLAITRAILEAERRSRLFIDHRADYPKLKFSAIADTWFNKFFQSVTEGCRLDALPARLREIAVISFNYDRCFKFFLSQSLANYYCIDINAADKLAGLVEIIHPYGSTGILPSSGITGIPFGATNLTGRGLWEVSKNIKTFSESIDDTDDTKRMAVILSSAQRVIFLGFAYHPANVELLFPAGKFNNENARILGTAFQISKSDVKHIKSDLMGRFENEDIELADLTCSALYTEHWRRLSMVR